jgi:hypothetical protein
MTPPGAANWTYRAFHEEAIVFEAGAELVLFASPRPSSLTHRHELFKLNVWLNDYKSSFKIPSIEKYSVRPTRSNCRLLHGSDRRSLPRVAAHPWVMLARS